MGDSKRNELKWRVFELHKFSAQRCLEPCPACAFALGSRLARRWNNAERPINKGGRCILET